MSVHHRACARCAAAKRSCDGGRPCSRCISVGHPHGCVELPDKRTKPFLHLRATGTDGMPMFSLPSAGTKRTRELAAMLAGSAGASSDESSPRVREHVHSSGDAVALDAPPVKPGSLHMVVDAEVQSLLQRDAVLTASQASKLSELVRAPHSLSALTLAPAPADHAVRAMSDNVERWIRAGVQSATTPTLRLVCESTCAAPTAARVVDHFANEAWLRLFECESVPSHSSPLQPPLLAPSDLPRYYLALSDALRSRCTATAFLGAYVTAAGRRFTACESIQMEYDAVTGGVRSMMLTLTDVVYSDAAPAVPDALACTVPAHAATQTQSLAQLALSGHATTRCDTPSTFATPFELSDAPAARPAVPVAASVGRSVLGGITLGGEALARHLTTHARAPNVMTAAWTTVDPADTMLSSHSRKRSLVLPEDKPVQYAYPTAPALRLGAELLGDPLGIESIDMQSLKPYPMQDLLRDLPMGVPVTSSMPERDMPRTLSFGELPEVSSGFEPMVPDVSASPTLVPSAATGELAWMDAPQSDWL